MELFICKTILTVIILYNQAAAQNRFACQTPICDSNPFLKDAKVTKNMLCTCTSQTAMYFPTAGDSLERIGTLFHVYPPNIRQRNNLQPNQEPPPNELLYVPGVNICSCHGPEVFQGYLESAKNEGRRDCKNPPDFQAQPGLMGKPSQRTTKPKVPANFKPMTTLRPKS